jgi:hypothetical protein
VPTTLTKRITGTASGGKTARVSEAPAGSQLTSRIHHLLLLEGDESGYLLLEGDMSTLEGDALKLEGDATAMTENTTRRITEAVE